jgi:hypothetical protein
MWEATIAGAGGLMSLYVALRREVRRSHELVQKDLEVVQRDLGQLDGRLGREIGRVETSLGEMRADIRRLDEKVDAVRGELIGFLGPR